MVTAFRGEVAETFVTAQLVNIIFLHFIKPPASVDNQKAKQVSRMP